MTVLEGFKILGVALAIGLLIGLERGWRARDKSEGMRIAGLRTYGLISLLGGITGILAQQAHQLFLGFAFVSMTVVFLVAYSKSLDKFEDYSITSIVASLISFSLGALTAFGHITLASAAAVVITFLLGFKPMLHGWVNKLDQRELEATVKLLLISVVMLPVLPDRTFGPWEVINPYLIWWMVVLIAGVSYLGYFSVKIIGNRHGPMVTGISGGLVSSTAVTLNLAAMSKHCPEMKTTLTAGILAACATMFVRTLVLVSMLNPDLLAIMLPGLCLMSLVTYLPAFLLWRTTKEINTCDEIKLENPFQLGMAVKFGALLIAILLLSKILTSHYGNMGTYFLAAASGIADVDPITLSMSQLSKTGLEPKVAADAIFIAVAANSVVKIAISFITGNRALGFGVGAVLTLALLAGALLT